MLFSRLALLLVIVEYGCIAYGFSVESAKLLYHIFIYGSPAYLAQNLLGANSALIDSNPFFIGILVFHVLKYACFFKAKIAEELNWALVMAVIGEIAYVAYSGYLLYF